MEPSEKTISDLLSEKMQEGRQYAYLSFTALSIYLAINGVLVAQVFGEEVSEAAPLMKWIGFLTAVLYVWANVLHILQWRRFNVEVNALLDLFQPRPPLQERQFMLIRDIAFIAGGFALVGWSYVLLGQPCGGG